MTETDGLDVQKVLVQNERASGLIVQQRAQLDAQDKVIRRLKAEAESLRNSCGVLRFRLWKREVSGVIPKGEVVVEHSWTDESATYRSIIVRMPKEQAE